MRLAERGLVSYARRAGPVHRSCPALRTCSCVVFLGMHPWRAKTFRRRRHWTHHVTMSPLESLVPLTGAHTSTPTVGRHFESGMFGLLAVEHCLCPASSYIRSLAG